MSTLTNYLTQADNLRFKLLVITGNDKNTKNKIVDFLVSEEWTLVDVGKELVNLHEGLPL